MKIKQKILCAMLATTLSVATYAQQQKNIEVNVENNNGVITKTIIVDGQVLSEDEISQMQADGDLKIIHLGDTSFGQSKYQGNNNVSINVESIDGITSKQVTINGKQLSDEEISELEANGNMHTFNMTSPNGSMSKMIFIKSDGDLDPSIDKHEMKFITKSLNIDDDHATLGFMANVQSDGWHVISVIENSGAQDAGMKAGDIVKLLGGVDLTNNDENSLQKTLSLIQKEEGDIVDMQIDRNGQTMALSVEAKMNDSADILMDLNIGDDFNWTGSIDGAKLSKQIKVMVMNTDNSGDFNFNKDDINVVFPDKLGDLSMFISNGSSTSKLLGKNHELSALSSGLAEYFNTDSGVLVLKAGKDNVFGLKDGDVIHNINGVDVFKPKDVIKQLLLVKKQQNIELDILRHKENKTLNFQK